MSEVNKEQADRCVQRAKHFLATGNYDKATKFLEKSIRLCDDPEIGARKLLVQVRHLKAANNQSPRPRTQTRHHNNTSSTTTASTRRTQSAGNLSERDRKKNAECERVLAIKDYYQILGIERTATADMVKRAYRKMALKFHPDKNPNVARAADAFKHISKANTVLTDADKKAFYDRTGEDPEATPGGGRGHGGSNMYNDQTPDIFEMFFGGRGMHGMHRRGFRVHRQRNGQAQQQQGPVNPLAQLVQLLPLIFLALTVFSSSLISPPQPEFSFERKREYGKPDLS